MNRQSGAGTRGWTRLEVGGGVPLETFAVVYHAIVEHQQVRACLKGHHITFCPHALGWRHEDPYVLGLILSDRRPTPPEPRDAEAPVEWQWLRLADLEIPTSHKGDWLTRPPDLRPQAARFLTETYVELP
jgi:hypothetical protein